jgi:hypothetical protein
MLGGSPPAPLLSALLATPHKRGHTTVTVVNGREAVAAVTKEGAHVPIIALKPSLRAPKAKAGTVHR